MKYYAVADIDINDPSWVPAYVKNVTAMVERYGGRYLARTSNVEKIEGDRPLPQLFVIIEWPSREAAHAFYESEEYRRYREDRKRGARNDFVLVAGEDVSKPSAIPG